ncbi:MAG TPA: hypothetical protein VGA37_14260 [Gemmatimonadales bacterium]
MSSIVLARLTLASAMIVGFSHCGDPQKPGSSDLAPTALTFATPQTGVILGDTLQLGAWFLDAENRPIGIPPDTVVWTSDDNTVLASLGRDRFHALKEGLALVRGATTYRGRTFEVDRVFAVVPSIPGGLVWLRQAALGGPMRLVWSPSTPINPEVLPPAGHPDGGQGLPAVSPDGRMVIVQSPRSLSATAPFGLFSVDLVTGSVFEVTSQMTRHQVAPRWAPDGDKLIFTSNERGPWDLWSIDYPDLVATLRVQLDATRPIFFDVAPNDGRLVAALPTTPGGEDLWEGALGELFSRRITATPAVSKTNPRVNASGDLIAYTSFGHDSTDANTAQVITRATGNLVLSIRQTLLPAFASSETNHFYSSAEVSSWSVDDRFLLISWSVNGRRISSGSVADVWDYSPEIYAIRVADTLAIRLTRYGPADVQAEFVQAKRVGR